MQRVKDLSLSVFISGRSQCPAGHVHEARTMFSFACLSLCWSLMFLCVLQVQQSSVNSCNHRESPKPALTGQLKSQILPHHFPRYVRKSSLSLIRDLGSAFWCVWLGYFLGSGNSMGRVCAALNTVETAKKRQLDHLTGTGNNCSLNNGFSY